MLERLTTSAQELRIDRNGRERSKADRRYDYGCSSIYMKIKILREMFQIMKCSVPAGFIDDPMVL